MAKPGAAAMTGFTELMTAIDIGVPAPADLPEVPGALAGLFPEALLVRLVRLRRDLHRHPELSGQEHQTAERLERELEALAPLELRRVAGTGVVARIRGRRPGAPVVAIRGDIDALPIAEETGLDFASQRPGVMHACGHDVHSAWTVGAAGLLSRAPSEGDVLVVLQPAEENGQGARAVLASGALDDARMIFGGHVDPQFAIGRVVVQSGALAAATDAFTVVLEGRGAHAARPHQSADPIVAGAAVVAALQTVVSRRIDPSMPAVLTVGTFHAGTVHNVIPQRAELTGTLRSSDPEVRERLVEEVRSICEGVAGGYGVRAEVAIRRGTPPVLNDPRATALVREAVVALLGAEAVATLSRANMGGEDFACYQERMAGCFFRVGAQPQDRPVSGAHSSTFVVDERCLLVGAAVLAEAARRASAALAG
jgi:amidohydrolase